MRLKLDSAKEGGQCSSPVVQTVGNGGPGIMSCSQVWVQGARLVQVLKGSREVHLHVPGQNKSGCMKGNVQVSTPCMAPVVVKKCQLLGLRLSGLFQQLSVNDLCLLEPSLRAEPLRILTACNHPHQSGKWNSQLPKIYISGIHEQDGTELSGIKIETESTIFLATIYKVIHRLEEVWS